MIFNVGGFFGFFLLLFLVSVMQFEIFQLCGDVLSNITELDGTSSVVHLESSSAMPLSRSHNPGA